MKPIKRLSEFIDESTPFVFLKVCIKPEDKLSEHEYYIQMITDNLNMYTSEHVKFIDPYTSLVAYRVGGYVVASPPNAQIF